jgi:hypothetical protein
LNWARPRRSVVFLRLPVSGLHYSWVPLAPPTALSLVISLRSIACSLSFGHPWGSLLNPLPMRVYVALLVLCALVQTTMVVVGRLSCCAGYDLSLRCPLSLGLGEPRHLLCMRLLVCRGGVHARPGLPSCSNARGLVTIFSSGTHVRTAAGVSLAMPALPDGLRDLSATVPATVHEPPTRGPGSWASNQLALQLAAAECTVLAFLQTRSGRVHKSSHAAIRVLIPATGDCRPCSAASHHQ